MLNRFQKIYTQDGDLTTVQENVEGVIAPLFLVPFLDGNLLENISVSGTAAEFNHKLERAWRGFFVVKSSADVRVFSPAQTSDPKVKIPLQASGAGTVSVWVF